MMLRPLTLHAPAPDGMGTAHPRRPGNVYPCTACNASVAIARHWSPLASASRWEYTSSRAVTVMRMRSGRPLYPPLSTMETTMPANSLSSPVMSSTRRIILTGDDAGVLIGHHGETLDALQYLSNLACTKKNAEGERDHSRVTLDIQGYRAKREETLRALARAKAQKALRTGRNVMLEPMNAYERRIIHSEVQTISGVSTNSIGSDNNRKVVIYLVDEEEKAVVDEAIDTLDTQNEETNA